MKILYRITADGTDVTGNFSDRLVSLTITDEAGSKSDTAEIRIDDRDYAVELPKTGAKLGIAMGVGELVQLGTYVVDELSGELSPAEMTICAKAADMLGGIRARKTRPWRDVTVQDIVAKIAGEHGLTPSVSDSLKSHFFGYLAQTTESDLNLLTRIGRDLDAVAKPAGGHLLFTKRGEGKAADGSALPVFDLDIAQIADGSWEVNGRGRYGKVIAEWTDVATTSVQKCTAGDKEPELRLRHQYASKNEAQKAADAALSRSQRSSGKISLHLGGFWGDLTAEAKINLTGVKPELAGEWLITRVMHRLEGTLTTSLEAERDNEGAST